MIRSEIIYLLPLHNVDPALASPFQGFTEGILKVTKFIEKILFLPANVVELYSPRRRVISSRMNGWGGYSIVPIRKEELKDLLRRLDTPFLCIFSQRETLDHAIKFIKSVQIPILHVSTESLQNAISFEELGRDNFFPYISQVVQYLKSLGLRNELLPLINLMKKAKGEDRESNKTNSWNHMATIPNELVLSSLGFEPEDQGPLIAPDNEPYVQAIAETAGAVRLLREKIAQHGFTIPYRPAVALILTAQSLYRHLYKVKLSNHKLKGIEDASAFIKVHRLLKKQKTFSFISSLEELEEIYNSPPWSIAFKIRKDETAAYTMGVSVQSCSNIAPVLRLPPVVNTFHDELENLGTCARGDSPHKQYKMNKISRRINNRLSEAMEQEYLCLLPEDLSPIKVIADLPLEWLQVGDLPLMLKFDTSRIPTTPGDLFFYQSILSKHVIIHLEDFEHILIVRSFHQDDPVRNILKSSLDILNEPISLQPIVNAFKDDREFQESARHQLENKDSNTRKLNITLHWVDIDDEEQFVQAVNNYKGPIMIFDGHGTHEKHRDVGSLFIGSDKVDLWSLRGKVRIPPIVLLSACDTHPIDRSHASVANGFLAVGATTVLGTVLPIQANHAAAFIMRLILRLREFLPVLIQKQDDCIRWTRVVSGLQRMSYVTELFRLLNSKGGCHMSADAYFSLCSTVIG